MKEIPSLAFWLGWAGVIPFAALSSGLWTGGAGDLDETGLLRALISYGAIILSFMGGVQWGLELTRGDGDGLGFLASVVPALAAFAATFVHPLAALAILAAGFILLLFYDLRRIRAGIGPAWYGRLRIQLSTSVVICLIAAAVAVMRV
jgi:hypothetical protein